MTEPEPVKQGDEEKPGVCRACGTDVDVTFESDPYAHEIDGDDTPVWMCDSCRKSSAWDV